MFIWWLTILANFLFVVNCYSKYSENANSCIDSCSQRFDSKFKVNLEKGVFSNNADDLVEVLEGFQSNGADSFECSKNILLRVPFYKLLNGTIVKIELDYGDLARGISFHVGNSPTNDLNGGDQNSTMYNAEVYANDTNIDFFMSSVNLCDQKVDAGDLVDTTRILFLNETPSYIFPKTKLIVYVAEKWIRVDNLERNTSFYYNNDYLFTFWPEALSENCRHSSFNKPPFNRLSPFLYIGLNRAIASDPAVAPTAPGSGLCNAEISFLNCFTEAEPDLDVNIAEMDFKQYDKEDIYWVNKLDYLEHAMEHAPCSGQGVVKLKFDPESDKKIARFDLAFGENLSGFTFNIGDSPSNNAYGGDSGTTSNSAEIHSNDNRFYVWLNTKYCGDTLLYKIEYNLFQNNDVFTIFVSDQRIEITNNRGYHEIFKNPYLFNLNGQNVTCNCFDTRCYPGVQADDELYVGLNRVIGGTYRPGIGLCNAKITWLQCKNDIRSNTSLVDVDYVNWSSGSKLNSLIELEETLNKTTKSPSVQIESNSTSSADLTSTDRTTQETDPSTVSSTTTTTTTTETTTSTTTLVTETTETTETTTESTTTTTELTTTEAEKLETTTSTTTESSLAIETNATTVESIPTVTETSMPQPVTRELLNDYSVGHNARINLGMYDKGRPLIINRNITILNEAPRSQDIAYGEKLRHFVENKFNPCTQENVQRDLLYHEFADDETKFIFCDGVNQPKIFKCPLNMKWSQNFQQCLMEN